MIHLIDPLPRPRYILLDHLNNVVAEIIDDDAIRNIDKYSIISWRGKNYIYNRHYTNGEYQFFTEAGGRLNLHNDRCLKIRENTDG